jgi:prepilin-type N-terminal cleavage/methylation domain-containing protein
MTNAAYTMLEVIIATLILAVMLTGVTQSMISGSMLVEAVSQQAELTNNSNAAIHHLSQKLRGADVDYVY